MEYTKDIVLEIKCKRGIGESKLKTWTSSIVEYGKENKMMFHIILLLSLLIAIDLVLVNSFLQLFSKVY